MEGPGEVFPRREFHAITDSMAVLDRGLLDSQVLGTSVFSFLTRSLPGARLERDG